MLNSECLNLADRSHLCFLIYAFITMVLVVGRTQLDKLNFERRERQFQICYSSIRCKFYSAFFFKEYCRLKMKVILSKFETKIKTNKFTCITLKRLLIII